jgi:hypothetical protein
MAGCLLVLGAAACAHPPPEPVDEAAADGILEGPPSAGPVTPSSGPAGAPPTKEPMRPDAPAPDASEPPSAATGPATLVIEVPPRGARIDGPVHVVGRLSGGVAPVLEVAGQRVARGPDGGFSVEVATSGGLTRIVTTVTDEGAVVAEDRRAVVTGARGQLEGGDDVAARAVVDGAGLAAISEALGPFVRELDFQSLIGESSGDFEIRDVSFDDVEIALSPGGGVLHVQLDVHDLRVRARGEFHALVRIVAHGTARSRKAIVRADVVPTATPDGGLSLDIVRSDVDLNGFEYDIENVPGFVEDAFRGTVRDLAESTVRDALRDQVLDDLFDPAALAQRIEILGRLVEVALSIDSVAVTPDGLAVDLGARVMPDTLIHDAPVVTRSSSGMAAGAGNPLDLGVTQALLGRVLHAAWAGGVLDLALGDGGDIDLLPNTTVGLFAAALGEAAEGIERSAPLRITTEALLPPVARLETGHAEPLVVEIGDFMLHLGTDTDELVSVAVDIVARVGVALVDEDGALRVEPTFEVDVGVDVAETPRGPVNAAQLEAQLGALLAALPALLGDQALRIGADALPVAIRFVDPRVEAAADGGALHVRTAITH